MTRSKNSGFENEVLYYIHRENLLVHNSFKTNEIYAYVCNPSY